MAIHAARLTRARVTFERDVHDAHLRFRRGLIAYLRGGTLGTWLVTPVIYSLLAPFALLHAWVWLYQRVCFPVYGIVCVPSGRYFALDRHRLAYLNGLEKMNCTFCTYANGVIAFTREVAARTEQYWCPIKHSRAIPAPHPRYDRFFAFGDAQGYRRDLEALRSPLKDAHDTASDTDQRE